MQGAFQTLARIENTEMGCAILVNPAPSIRGGQPELSTTGCSRSTVPDEDSTPPASPSDGHVASPGPPPKPAQSSSGRHIDKDAANAAEDAVVNNATWSRGVVAFLDILGTKGIHSETHLREEYRIRRRLILGLNAGSTARVFGSFLKLISDLTAKAAKGKAGASDIRRRAIAFSDTIVLTADRDSAPEGTIEVICDVIANVIRESLSNGVFLRGAVSFGEFFVDEDLGILLGPAVVDAYEWSEAAEWIGVHLTPTAFYAWKGTETPPRTPPTIREYNVPLKEGRIIATAAVDWAHTSRSNPGEIEALRVELMRAFSRRPIALKDESKYRNTLAFL